MKLGIIIGTRPEVIKMSPVIRECQKRKLDFFVLHTGQHYSYDMDEKFFQELELPQPKYNLKVGQGASRFQVRIMIKKITDVLNKENPSFVLVLGDTNTTLAGSLAANRSKFKLVHLEGGLRSFDIVMAEEVNRMIADYLSELIFLPTQRAKENLLNEGVSQRKMIYSGNTIVDSVYQNLRLAETKTDVLKKIKIKNKQFFLITLHRAENVDIKERLEHILSYFKSISSKFKIPLVFPVHPRTHKMIEQFELNLPKGVIVTKPVGFLEFLQLESKAKLIITDSGGVQEEACIMKVPCVTLRDNTERPETVEIGANVLCHADNDICKVINKMLKKKINWKNPYGEGKSAEKIITALINRKQQSV